MKIVILILKKVVKTEYKVSKRQTWIIEEYRPDRSCSATQEHSGFSNPEDPISERELICTAQHTLV